MARGRVVMLIQRDTPNGLAFDGNVLSGDAASAQRRLGVGCLGLVRR